MKNLGWGFLGLLMFAVQAQAVESVPQAQASSYIFNVTYDDAQEAIGKALTEKLFEQSGGKNISAVITGRKLAPLYSSNKPVAVEVRGLRADNAKGDWSASMVIIGDDENIISAMPLSGRYSMMEEVPVFKRPLRNGDVIGEGDVEIKSFPQDRVGNDAVVRAEDLIGRTPVRAVSPNRPIRESEVSAPAIIKKNALIKLRYKTDAMEITASGQAMGDGAKGDVIEVRNTESKKVVRAVVAGSDVADALAVGTQTSKAGE